MNYDTGVTGVTAGNEAPVFVTNPVVTATAGQAYRYQTIGFESDGGGLSYVLASGPAGMSIDPNTGLVTWNPTTMSPAHDRVAVQVYNDDGAFDTQVYTITVAGVNAAPAFAGLPASVSGQEGVVLTVPVEAIDPQNAPLTFWADNLPPGAVFDPAKQALEWTPAYGAAGTYPNVAFTVSDGTLQTTQDVTIVIAPNPQPPTLLAPPVVTGQEGSPLQLQLQGSDQSGAPLTYSSTNLPSGASLDPTTGLLTWTPDFTQEGIYKVPVTVSDGKATTTQTADFVVFHAFAVPVFQNAAAFLVRENQHLEFQATAYDANNPAYVPPIRNADGTLTSGGGPAATVTETVSGLPTGATFDPDTWLFDWTPTFHQEGIFTITLTATKAGASGPLIASQTVSIDVLPVDLAPQLTPIVDQTVQGGQTLDVPVTAVDPLGGKLTLAVSGLPSFGTFTDNGDGTGTFHFAPGLPAKGNYTITIQATDDGRGGQTPPMSSQESFVLDVAVASEPPQLQYIGDKVAVIGSPFQLTLYATDLDQQPLTFSANGLPAGATITPSHTYGQAVVSWVPTAADAGTYAVTFVVTNTGNGNPTLVASDQQTINLVVRANDQAPVLANPGDQSVVEGQTLTITLAATDPDGDSLTYSVANAPLGSIFDPVHGILTLATNLFEAGDYPNVTFSASDGFLTSTQSITIHITKTNHPPTLLPVGTQAGREGALVKFTLLATDPDGGDQTYAAVTSLPAGAALDPQTGIFTWTPSYTQAGNYTITFSATDPGGLSSKTTVSIQIANVDRAPTLAVSDQTVLVGAGLDFTLDGSDPDVGDVLTYSATGLPAGASLNSSTGAFAWTPGAGQAGTYPVVFTVSDGQLTDSQTAVIRALLSSQAPTVTLELTPSFPVDPGQQVLVQATATGLASIATLSLTMDGQPVTLDAQGRYFYTASTPGRVQFVATATDVGGQVGSASTVVKVIDPSDAVAPVVSLASSLNGAVLTAPTAVVGEVDDSNLDSWTLQIALLGSTDVTTLASGTAPVANATLANLDPGTLENGVYVLTLVATDIAGRTSEATATLEIDTVTKSVQYVRTETDLSVQLGAATVNLTRVYDSLARNESSSFGYGWSLAVVDTNLQTSVVPTGNELVGIYNPFIQGTRVYLTLPDGQRVGFTFTPVRHDQPGVTWYTPAFTADPGVNWQLNSASAVLIRGGNGFYDAQTAVPYNPASGLFAGPQYTLTGPDGTVYQINAASGVQEEILPGGQQLYYSGSGISSSSGGAIRFVRDASGRITSIEAPDGSRVVYSYDTAGNLVSAHNAATGASSRYGYDANDIHLLTLATAPASATGSGVAVSYGSTVEVVPLTADLGGTSQFVANSDSNNLVAGATDTYTFLLTAAEMGSTASGTVLVSVWINAASGSSLQPAVPVIAGVSPLVQRTGSGTSFGLFALDRAGLERLEIMAASGGTSGGYSLQIMIAGDANLDGNVNGADGTLLAKLIGITAGQPGYTAAADGNDDGLIDAADVQLVAANYGFQATQPPAVQAGNVMTHAGLPVQFDLAPLATDPQGDPLFFRIVGADGGTATLNPDGHTVTFVPAPGFTGAADFQFEADDGLELSAPGTITVTVSAAPLVSLDFQTREPRLAVGGGTQIVVIGNFADEQGVLLDPSYVTFESTNPQVATISSLGELAGLSAGTSVLLVSSQGLQAATAVTVGPATSLTSLDQTLYNEGINPYPLAVSLSVEGGSRQFDVHPVGDINLLTDLSTASSGTQYFVSTPGIVTITPDGLMTAVSPGQATVTIINGPAEAVIPVLVQMPRTGTVTLGAGGGVVEGSDGSIVAVPPSDLTTGAPVSITPATQASLPEALPDGITFAGAFNLNIGDTGLAVPVQLAIPVAAGTPVGSTVYFYRAGQFLNADGTTQPIWWQVESGTVAANGMAYTHSPPEPGVGNSGLYLIGYSQDALAEFDLELANSQIAGAEAGLLGVSAAIAGAGGSLVGAMAAVNAIGIDATLAVPAATAPTPVLVSILQQTSLPFITTYDVQLQAGQVSTFSSTINVPPPVVANAPQINAVSLTGNTQAPEVQINGSGFMSSNPVEVTFQQANGRKFTATADSVAPNEITVPIPDGVVLGISQITVVRQDLGFSPDPSNSNGSAKSFQDIASNPAQFNPSGNYAFVALPEGEQATGALEVIDNNSADTAFGSALTEISLGTTQNPTYPRDVAITPDDSRAYVTLEQSGQVAVVDTITLQEVNVHPSNSTAAAAAAPPSLPTTGVVLDPSLYLLKIANPIDIYGTANVPGQASWELQLGAWSTTWEPIGAPLAQGDGTVSDGLLTNFDASSLASITNGYYVLRLTAFDASDNPIGQPSVSLIGVDTNTKVIDLPLGAEPYGIAIDPQGNYAYVADARPYRVSSNYVPPAGQSAPSASAQCSQVYVIDINPASPLYDQVVETIQVVLSGALSDGTQPSVADPNGLIAPDGLRDITVTPDGKQLDVAAPNFNSDPNGGPFDELNGNMIQITLAPQTNYQPPQVSNIVAIPGGQGTYGVAVAPTTPAAQLAAKETGQPVQYAVAFTNPESDSLGVEVVNPVTNTKTTIPLDLDPADDPNNPQYNYVQANSNYANATYLEAHNAGGIVFYTAPNGTVYAFVAGRADQVTSVTGGGNVGDDLIASATTGYLDQDQNPLFEDGNVAIIENPLGDPNGAANQRPVVVGATRPVPYGYPVDLALTAPDATGQQYLYVSYQGLPTISSSGSATNNYGSGAIFVFNATAMINMVSTLSQTQAGSLILDQVPVDDITMQNGQPTRALNTTIDVRAAYAQYLAPVLDASGQPEYDSNGNPITQEVFGVPTGDNAYAPISTGGFPGGIAIETGSAPQLTATNPVVVTTTVDEINQTVSTTGGAFTFSLNTPAIVTLEIQDAITDEDVDSETISEPGNPNDLLSLEDFKDSGISLSGGSYTTSLAPLGLQETPGTYNFTLTATTPSGKSTSVTGTIILELKENASLPVGHTIIDGVDIWDGHLTITSDDITIPGQGLDLDFSRTYSNKGNSSAGPLGAGWTDSYNVQLIENDNGTFTIIGGDGSGNTFSAYGAQNPTEAQEFGLPGTAIFYNPQVGYHSTLIQPDPNKGEFYFYTTDHTLYDFQLQPALAPGGQVYTLRYIQDSDGNRISLFYNQDPTGTLPSDPNLQADLNGPALALGVIEDSSGRALLLDYQLIFNANRIVKITGYDNTGSVAGNLLGLEIDYSYDQWGNLTSVARVDAASGAVLRKEEYTYSPGAGITGHNLLTYTEPNAFDAQGNPIGDAAAFTTTYAYYGLDPSGNPIDGEGFNQDGAYTGIYNLQLPNFNPFFGVPLFEMVASVTQPGGSAPDGMAVTTFVYNLSTNSNSPNTRVVSDPRPGVPPTTYTLDAYGATIEISAPDGSGKLGDNITTMTWADPSEPQPQAFSAVDGALTPNELKGIDVEMVSITDPEGRMTSYMYDVNGNLVTQTISFAGMGNAYLPVTRADGTTPVAGDAVTSSYTYDPVFNVMTSQTDANGHTSFKVYDSTYESLNPLPNLSSSLAGGAALPAFTGFNTGDLLATIDAVGDTTLYTYATSATVGSNNSISGYNGTFGLGDLMTKTVVRGGGLNEVTRYLQYDPYGNATKSEDAEGNDTIQTFDVRSRPTTVTTYGGQSTAQSTTVYAYDGLDRVVRQAEFDDLVQADNAFSLPQDSGLSPITLADGQVAQATVNTLPPAFAGAKWAEESLSQYLPGGQVVQTINGLGQVTLDDYDNGDRLITETDKNVVQAGGKNVSVGQSSDLVASYDYDANDNLVEAIDQRGIITINTYNDLNQLTETTVLALPASADPVGTNVQEVTMKAVYDLAGNKLTDTDVHGNVTAYEYDGLYRLAVTVLPVAGPSGQAAMVKTAYDPLGNVVAQTDANGNATSFSYDAANRLTMQTDPMGNRVEYGYDAAGNIILETHESPVDETPTGPAPGTTYDVTYVVAYPENKIDALNRPTEMDQYVVLGDPTIVGSPAVVADAGQTKITTTQAVYVTTYYYDDVDNRVTTTDPRGNDPSDDVTGETLDQNDGLGRLRSETVDTGGLNLVTSYTYDADGNQATVKDPTSSTVTYFYNGLDELIETVDPMISPGVQYKTYSFYDGDGNLVKGIDARGIVSTTDYDNLNRVVAQNVVEMYSDGGKDVTLTSNDYQDAGVSYGAFKAYRVTVTDANGNATTTEYDALGRPVLVTDPYQNTVVSTYDGVNLVTETDQDHNTTVYHYDADNRPIQTDEEDSTGTLQSTTKEAYLDADNQDVVTGPRSVGGAPIVSVTQNDSLGRVVFQSVENPSLSAEYATTTVVQVQNVYDGDGNLVMTTDANNNQTKYVYDGANRQIQMIEGYGSTVQAATTYTYDKAGDLVSIKDARPHGAPTQPFPEDLSDPSTAPPATFDAYYTYDAMHRQITATDGDGDTTTYAYNGDNDIISMTTPNKNTTFYSYDEFGNVLSVDESGDGGGITRYVYDGNGNMIAQQDANGNLTTFEYDKLNQLIATYQFLTPGILTASSTRDSVTGQLYPQNPSQSVALVWQLAYNPNGDKTLVIDPEGQETHMMYDYRDRLISETFTNAVDPGLAYQPLTITYAYDNDNNLTETQETKTGPSGNIITEQYVYTYDALDRLTETARDDDLGAADDIVNDIGYTYDRQGNLKSETVPGANLPLAAGTPTASTTTTTYDYDARNRLIDLNTGSGTTSYTYWQDNLVASIQYPNGVIADSSYSNSYDAAGRLTLLVNHAGPPGSDPSTGSSDFISSFLYTYDSDGNRLSQTEAHFWPSGTTGEVVSEQTTYTYDKLDRLASVQYVGIQNGVNAALSYKYDLDGNRLSEIGTDPSAPSQQVNLTYAYNRLNELMAVVNNIDASRSTAFTYDANGNRTMETVGQVTATTNGDGNPVVTVITASSMTPYFYNILDELVKTMNVGSGGVVTFDYDASGMRDEMIDSTGDTRFLYDGSNSLVLQYDGVTAATIFRYNYGLALVSTVDAAGDEQFYLFDVLGSVSELTSQAGTIVEGMQYDAFGNVIQSFDGGSSPVEFTGQLADPDTGLDYFGARYYDPATGTFITQDNEMGDEGVPISLDRYLYALDNPLKYIDPTGHDAVDDALGWAKAQADKAAQSDAADWFYKNSALTVTAGVGHAAYNGITNTFNGLKSVGEGLGDTAYEATTIFSKSVDEKGLGTALLEVADAGASVPSGLAVDVPKAVNKALVSMDKAAQGAADKYLQREQVAGSTVATILAITDATGTTGFGEAMAGESLGLQKLSLEQQGYRGATSLAETTGSALAVVGGAQLIGGAAKLAVAGGDALIAAVGATGEGAILGDAAVQAASKTLTAEVAATANNAVADAVATGSRAAAEGSVNDTSIARGIGMMENQEGAQNCIAQCAKVQVEKVIGRQITVDEFSEMTASIYDEATVKTNEEAFNVAAAERVKLGDSLARSVPGASFDQLKTTVLAGQEVQTSIVVGPSHHAVTVTQIYVDQAGEEMVVFQHSGPSAYHPNVAEVLPGGGFEEEMHSSLFRGQRAAGGSVSIVNYPTGSIRGGIRLLGSQIDATPSPVTSADPEGWQSTLTAALTYWAAVLSEPVAIAITVDFGSLPADELGQTLITAFSPNGLPTAGTVLLSTDAGGAGWYVDPTPLDSSGFATEVTPDAFDATGDSPAAGEYDLYTVLLHEIGHLLGIDPQIPGFVAHVGMLPGSAVFAGLGISATLTPQADDLDANLYSNDLMSLSLSPGERRLPSQLDVQIIDMVRGIAPAPNEALVFPSSTTTTVSHVSATPPTVQSVSVSPSAAVAAVDQVLATTQAPAAGPQIGKKRHPKVSHGKKTVRGPLGHGATPPRKHLTISLGKPATAKPRFSGGMPGGL